MEVGERLVYKLLLKTEAFKPSFSKTTETKKKKKKLQELSASQGARKYSAFLNVQEIKAPFVAINTFSATVAP